MQEKEKKKSKEKQGRTYTKELPKKKKKNPEFPITAHKQPTTAPNQSQPSVWPLNPSVGGTSGTLGKQEPLTTTDQRNSSGKYAYNPVKPCKFLLLIDYPNR